MRRSLPCLMAALSLAAAGPLAAQEGADANPALDALRPLYQQVRAYVTASAEQMPEDRYDYRPTPEVRSFGELLGHIINDHWFFCSAARDVDNPSDRDYETLATKEEFVQALEESFAYCDPLYTSLTLEEGALPSRAFRGRRNRLHPLVYNVTHDFEHYGNIITYFRMNGMVPPSSQRGG